MSISITDAFGADKIALAHVELDDQQEGELTAWLSEVVEEGGRLESEDVITLATLAFTAGRCYQSQFSQESGVLIEMNGPLLNKFLQFLAE